MNRKSRKDNLSKKWVLDILSIILMALVTGCGYGYSEYHFDGQINEEKVFFSEDVYINDNYLRVTRTDSVKIEYIDYYRNLKIDEVKITMPDGKITRYLIDSKNPLVKKIIEEEQEKFNNYLSKIHEINSAPLRK